MNIDYPGQHQMSQLRMLWQEAFKDNDAFVEHFYTHGFAPDRCRCVTVDGDVVAALYWFDCTCHSKPMAYLYGIATVKSHRGKGLYRALAEDTHNHLKSLGYSGEILVPAGESLQKMYEKMGYIPCTKVTEFSCESAVDALPLRSVDIDEYSRLRREFLPENGVIQEGDSLHFLASVADFYAGDNFLVCVYRDEKFFAPELLGNIHAAPGILAALHKPHGHFRAPGAEQPFAMYFPLSNTPAPGYFGLAFD